MIADFTVLVVVRDSIGAQRLALKAVVVSGTYEKLRRLPESSASEINKDTK